jgi:type II secretory pathway pseudopilin PulG
MLEPGQEKKKGFLDRLPKLGRISQLVLLIGIFLVIFVPLFVINQQQPERQSQLEATLSNLQKIVTAVQTPKDKFEADLAQATADTEAAKAAFPSSQGSPQILDSLRKLADDNDIYVTATKVSTSTPAGSIGMVLTVTLNLKGQVPLFQNFLLGLDTKLPTSQIKQVSFTITGVEGEYDTATVVMDILSYGGS